MKLETPVNLEPKIIIDGKYEVTLTYNHGKYWRIRDIEKDTIQTIRA